MDLQFRWLDPAGIDVADETFRIRRRHPPALEDSVRRAGIRTPLLVRRAPGCGERTRYGIVSGWGRWLARAGAAAVPAFVLPEELGLEATWNAFLSDNDRWNVLEAARVLAQIERSSGLGAERLVAETMPRLGLHASGDLLRRYLRLLELPPAAQAFVEDEDLPLRRALALTRFPGRDLEAFLPVARSLALTHSEVGEVIEQAAEIAARDGVGAGDLLVELHAGASSKEAFRRALSRRRFPDLHRRQRELEDLAAGVRLGVPAAIEWDPRLERPGVRLTADLADEAAVGRLLDSLQARRQALERLLRAV